MKPFFLSLSLFFAFLSLSFAQQKFTFEVQLDWAENGLQRDFTDGTSGQVPFFKDSYFSTNEAPLPVFHQGFDLDGPAELKATISNVVSEPISVDYDYDGINQSRDLIAKTTVSKGRRQYIGHVDICPIIYDGQNYKKVVSFDLNVIAVKINNPVRKDPPTATESVLADGDIYKIAVQSEGMHVMDMNFLRSELGIDISNISPSQFQIYGSGGGMVNEGNSESRVDDLSPIAMQMLGTSDGSFDNGDKIIFYAEGASIDKSDISTRKISKPINVYAEENYYFIKIGAVDQNNIQEISSVQNTTASTDQFDGFVNIEEDNINILHEYAFTQGSGSSWYMQKFEGLRQQTYNFTIPNIVTSEPMTVESVFAGRSDINTDYFMEINGASFKSGTISSVRTTNIEDQHANRIRFSQEVVPVNENTSVTIDYPARTSASTTGWLDYISINARQRLIIENTELIFRDFQSLDNTSTTFNIQTASSDPQVWNITDALNAKAINANFNNGTLSFGANTSTLQKFIAFDSNAINKSPTAVGQIENQNLHQIADADMIVIYPSEFEAQANRFAMHRSEFSQLDVKTILIDEIFNEFSSGRNDPTAIRDFCKLIYDRDPDFKYLLLFGDGSFDHRGIYDSVNGNNASNFITVFEEDSLNSIFAYPTDDYFALLDQDEGGDITSGGLDIAIGRFPVKTVTEAELVVNKIIDYETNPESFGNWRNDLVFVADDEDSNRHIKDADGIAELVRNDHNEFNINKLFADSYPQISTPGGEKYPDMTEELNKVMFQGALVVNYLGHGGSKGWAQERFLDLNDIDGWSNNTKLPLLVTATCSFTGYDDPTFVTAGERAFLHPNGGVIGLMTTVRAVFASSNERLTRSVFERIFEKENGKTMPFGDVMLNGKNAQSGGANDRKFSLIGDPSMRIAIPIHKVKTLSINGNPVDTMAKDTIHALDQVTIGGQVTDQNDQLLSDFNGKVFVKVFDKVNDISTLANDPGSQVRDFKSQKNLIFTGVASVTNGLFDIKFVVPRDIDYSFGNGKISYYATDDNSEDAGGFFTNFIVGGTNPDGVVDNEPPTIEVFMNNENFVLGGVTSPDPILLVKLSDNLGINVAGTSIGHDLTGVLDQDNNNAFALNDFYEAKIDDYTQGTVRFPIFDLASGRHEIKVKAWDVANNSSEAFTEFIVAENQNLALEQVLNYPNPFTTNTQFMFEHNLPGQLLDVQVRIFTVSGKLVKSINAEKISDGNRVRNITWDGKDDFGSDLARGVYLYKVKAAPSDNSGIEAAESEFEKLVILK